MQILHNWIETVFTVINHNYSYLIDHSGIFVTAMGDDESTPTAPRRKATSATTTSSASKSGSGSQQEREKARSARSGSR